jgi:hypothetical protein
MKKNGEKGNSSTGAPMDTELFTTAKRKFSTLEEGQQSPEGSDLRRSKRLKKSRQKDAIDDNDSEYQRGSSSATEFLEATPPPPSKQKEGLSSQESPPLPAHKKRLDEFMGLASSKRPRTDVGPQADHATSFALINRVLKRITKDRRISEMGKNIKQLVRIIKRYTGEDPQKVDAELNKLIEERLKNPKFGLLDNNQFDEVENLFDVFKNTLTTKGIGGYNAEVIDRIQNLLH